MYIPTRQCWEHLKCWKHSCQCVESDRKLQRETAISLLPNLESYAWGGDSHKTRSLFSSLLTQLREDATDNTVRGEIKQHQQIRRDQNSWNRECLRSSETKIRGKKTHSQVQISVMLQNLAATLKFKWSQEACWEGTCNI